MTAPVNLTDFFVDPPIDAVASSTTWPLAFAVLLLPLAVLVGIRYTRATRSPLYWWCAVSGALLYPFVVEPFGDWFVAVWYPTNHPIAATVFDRPMPWFVVAFYAAGIPLVSVAAYEMVKRGLPAARLLMLAAAVSVAEVPIEMIAAHQNVMIYYANHALVLGVPIYCWAQNGGMFVVVAWVLALLLPRVHGWTWIFVPLATAAALPTYAIVATWPAYVAIHTEEGPAVGWTAGMISLILNVAVAVWCAYSKPLARLRKQLKPAGTVQLATARKRT